MQTAMERLKHDLGGALHDVHADLERVEILTAALYGFTRPVPDYEPTFHHLSRAHLTSYELGRHTRPR